MLMKQLPTHLPELPPQKSAGDKKKVLEEYVDLLHALKGFLTVSDGATCTFRELFAKFISNAAC